MEVFTDCSSRSADTVGHRTKRMGASRGRSEKNAIRVCGDWSEQLSSKGKIYFYNCVTEVSQWQKPPEWNLPDLNSEELLRRVNARNKAEDKTLKRPRNLNSLSQSGTREFITDHRSGSPKRAKYSTEAVARKPASDQRYSPLHPLDTPLRTTCASEVCNRGFSQRYRGGSHTSPRRNYDCRVYPGVGSNSAVRKDHLNNMPSRSMTTDDMEISPNSSPMSASSSPINPTTNHRAFHTSRCTRPGTQRMPLGATRMHNEDSKGQTDYCANSRTPTLSQLVDAIRASIGGLLEQSPSSAVSKPGAYCSPSVNGVHPIRRNKLQVTSNTDSSHSANNAYDSPSPVSVEHGLSVSRRMRSPKRILGNVSIQPRVSDPKIRGDTTACPGNVSESQHYSNPQNKSISGLVSTLTSLVSRIGNSKYSSTSASSSPVASSMYHHPSIPHSAHHQASTHSHSISQRSYHHNISPAIPSPLTPSTHTGTFSSGGSSGSTLTHSVLTATGYNLSSHQMDDLLSSLENFTQKARNRGEFCTDLKHELPTRERFEFDLSTNMRLEDSVSRSVGRNCLRSCERPTNHTIEVNGSGVNQAHLDRPRSTQVTELVKILKTALHQQLNHKEPTPTVDGSPTPSRHLRTSSGEYSQAHPQSSGGVQIDPNPENPLCSPAQEIRRRRRSDNELKIQDDSIPNEPENTVSSTDPHANSYASPRLIHGDFSLSTTSCTPCSSNFPNSSSALVESGGLPPGCVSHAVESSYVQNTTGGRETAASRPTNGSPSPKDQPVEQKCLERISQILGSAEIQSFVDPSVVSKFIDKTTERLEQEAQVECRKFDRLHSVLYSELSAESKKLRALVRISEAKLAIHKEKQTSLQGLMDAIETRKQLLNLSFSDDVL
ncbi:unnamed protein product [Calicophoron daubneyi]|uniref:WW domain-containing protein n=1 Tax=Calicophoron daubneyi TaxID=300641 RepID=A0AAV2SZH7_CALDB